MSQRSTDMVTDHAYADHRNPQLMFARDPHRGRLVERI